MTSKSASKKSIFDPESIKITGDLVSAAKRHIEFLETVNHNSMLNNARVTDQALHRYETMWLPLLSNNKDRCRQLKPPFDVAWVAHCHQLAPKQYITDVTNLIGFVPDTESPSPTAVSANLSRDLWTQAYPGEPFELDLAAVAALEAGVGSGSKRIAYDIRGAMQRQKAFFYNVSLPHYRETEFLEASLTRYLQFLRLQQLCPQEFLVPCYDIDLMWHTHQLTPIVYEQDCMRLLNRLLSHDDNVGDRGEGSKLSKAYARTAELWSQHFGESYVKSGCMYRGEPPEGKLAPFSLDQMRQICQRRYCLSLTRLELTNPPPVERYKLALLAPVESGSSRKMRRLLKVGNSQGRLIESTQPPLAEFNYLVNGDRQCPLQLNLLDKRKGSAPFCGGGGFLIGDCELDLTAALQRLQLGEEVRNLTCDAFIATDPSNGGRGGGSDSFAARLTLSAKPPTLSACNLRLVAGDWLAVVMPTNVESLWGPVPLGHVPAGVEHRCIVASHCLVTGSSQLAFTVRVIHSQQLAQSVVQVFYGDAMVCVAHMVGIDQLPTCTKTSNSYSGLISLNPAVRQRAFLIKDATGDWGLLLGNWTGRRRGTPGRPGVPPVPGSPGYLDLTLHAVTAGPGIPTRPNKMRLPKTDKSDKHEFSIGGILVDFNSGSVRLESDCHCAPQLIAAAFCASALEAMCQPLPPAATATAAGQLAPSQATRYDRLTAAAQSLGPQTRLLGAPKQQALIRAKPAAPRPVQGRGKVYQVEPETVMFCQAAGACHLEWMPLRWHWHCGHWWQRTRRGSGGSVSSKHSGGSRRSGGSGGSAGSAGGSFCWEEMIVAGGFDDLQEAIEEAGGGIDAATGEINFDDGGGGGGDGVDDGGGGDGDFDAGGCGGCGGGGCGVGDTGGGGGGGCGGGGDSGGGGGGCGGGGDTGGGGCGGGGCGGGGCGGGND